MSAYSSTVRAMIEIFHVLVRSPLPDERAFVKRLAEENVFVLPGRLRIARMVSHLADRKRWHGRSVARGI